jgi:exodeoxyribonuclease V
MTNGNERQQIIFADFIKNVKALMDEAETLPHLVYSLIGSAGTGKTWLTAEIIKAIRDEGIDVAMTTPTHKALGVITEMLEKNKISEDVTKATIHSFLNLKLDYGFGEDGNSDNVTTKPKLKVNKFNECIQHTDILILDESSMVSEELYNLTLSILGDRCKMILFVGDQFQLKPIEGGENIIYNHPDIVHYELIETVRQKEGSSVIAKANEIRDYIKYQNYPPNIYDLFEETDEIKLLTDGEFLPIYFQDESKKMVGSYTNAMVDQYNKYVRYVETKELEYLCDQDEVVFQKPYTNSMGEVIFQNGEQVAIQSTKLVQDLPTGFWYWRCKGNGRMFNILDPQSEVLFKTKMADLAEVAKSSSGFNKTKAWKSFFKLQSKFGQVKYSYASTLHKLQGSTYEAMYFDMRDLGKFYRRDPDNILRLIYVAITRTSDKLYILND